MLEKLADYDDELMEQLLSDVTPPRDKIFQDLVTEFKQCQIVPVFFGSAEEGHGVGRLLKALRHEAPFAQETAKRLGLGSAKSAAYIMKTYHTSHAGKLSLARVLAGQFADGGSVYAHDGEEKISGVFSVVGTDVKKRGPGAVGETVALGKLESLPTGTTITGEKTGALSIKASVPPKPVYGLAIAAGERKDEIKLTSALNKLIDEDPSLSLVQDREFEPDGSLGPGRDASARRAGAPQPPLRHQGGNEKARYRLQGDHPQEHRDPRPSQEAERRARSIRRCGGGDQAAGARRGLRFLRGDNRRRRAAKLFPRGGDWRARLSFAAGRLAFRSWTSR